MNQEIIEKFLIADNQVLPVEQADELYPADGASIYEVIRVVEGTPLFLEQHMERLLESAKLLGCDIRGIFDELKSNIFRLIEVNGLPEKNVKVIVYNLSNSKPNYLIYFIKSSYPTKEQYEKGVDTILYYAERSNPNAKVVNLSFKEKVALKLEETGAYEALLVNEKGEITEGSRSNVFFVRDGKVFTSPAGSVLVGITRVYVFELCQNLGIEVVEQSIDVGFLEQAEGLFMTGTSPKILPIASVDGRGYGSVGHEVILELMAAYDGAVGGYVESRRGN